MVDPSDAINKLNGDESDEEDVSIDSEDRNRWKRLMDNAREYANSLGFGEGDLDNGESNSP